MFNIASFAKKQEKGSMASRKQGYRIRGGKPVVGEIECLGAKNFITKAMVAALLGDSPTTLLNAPPIGDTQITGEMLSAIGVDVQHIEEKVLRIDPAPANSSVVPLADSGSNRIPILMLSALLHRFDAVTVPSLGGCRIGARKVDFHIEAIRRFGGEVTEGEAGFVARRKNKLTGANITLTYPSVGATETCLYLSVLAEGRSTISNAAVEPEILELITMLRAMGAIIFTSPGREIRVEGMERLQGTRTFILGDRIEAASWACLACASDGEIIVHGIRPEILGNFLSYYQQVGGGFELQASNSIRFFRRDKLQPAIIETDVYPGFSTDWQQPFAILLTQANGISVIHETVYENRFGYFEALNKLGAKTQLTHDCLGGAACRFRGANHKHSAIIIGPTPFMAHDAPIEIPDLRAGLAYVIAAAIAKGDSIITGIDFLERGYGNIAPRLSAMNLPIESVVLK
jgi:UDP-N-acetylglucosamine 1-carboxyvinyltransferase